MKLKYSIILLASTLLFSSCEKFLDRPQLTSLNDDTAWNSEDNVRLYANKFYAGYTFQGGAVQGFFTGYGTGFTTTNAMLASYSNSDDMVAKTVSNFTTAVPNSKIWSFVNIRAINLMIDRVENRMGSILSADSYKHWIGIGRFFRAMAYTNLVAEYGDVPYYDKVVSDVDFDNLYKKRTARNDVMDAVYEDLKYAFENVKTNDGSLNVNRYIVAGFISRLALTEGSWQRYYYNNSGRAKEFFELAQSAGDYVINSGQYAIVTPYREQFVSENLSGNRDILLYRQYDETSGIKHSIASASNLVENYTYGPSADLIRSYLCVDGKVWQNSDIAKADNFLIPELVKTRDSRFEATFYEEATAKNLGAYAYIVKFLPRDQVKKAITEGKVDDNFRGATNTTDAPVLRYAEVLLNWIEAKAELAELGGIPVSQADIDRSINRIRERPLAPLAEAKGVKKTASMSLGNLPVDPSRDVSVSPLLWEIRRERRVEMTFEYSRLEDLKRWSKLNYMDTEANPYILGGAWINFPVQFPTAIDKDLSVINEAGQIVKFSSAGASKMVGFYRYAENLGRRPFLGLGNVNPYLSPVGLNQMTDYASRGYILQQTEGWPQN